MVKLFRTISISICYLKPYSILQDLFFSQCIFRYDSNSEILYNETERNLKTNFYKP